MTNRYMTEKWSWIEGTLHLRAQVLETLTDADLAFTPGGQALTLGALCREMGEVDHAYIESLRTLKQDFGYRHADARVTTSVDALRAWYRALDADLKGTVAAMSDDQLTQMLDRGFQLPVETQLDVYLQALLIFLGKVSVYLRAMNRPLPETLVQWIG